jgi:hypothetical protein
MLKLWDHSFHSFFSSIFPSQSVNAFDTTASWGTCSYYLILSLWVTSFKDDVGKGCMAREEVCLVSPEGPMHIPRSICPFQTKALLKL